MSVKAFLDTNIFVYAVGSSESATKRSMASELIREALTHHQSVISYQVIQEFLNVAMKKFSRSISIADAQEYLRTVLQPLLAVDASIELFREALDLAGRYQLSWYDSLIVAAAVQARCTTIYTEDMQHGARYGGVKIENPFRTESRH